LLDISAPPKISIRPVALMFMVPASPEDVSFALLKIPVKIPLSLASSNMDVELI